MNRAICPSQHIPVLSAEIIAYLNPTTGQVYVDGTLGGGGHTQLLSDCVGPTGTVLGLDRDPEAIARAQHNLAGRPVVVAHANFCDMPEVLKEAKLDRADGILLDLGISSDQLADKERGFSFDSDGLLDLRFDPGQGQPAWRLIERLSESSLADLIFQFGQERLSRRIARRIIAARRREPVRTAGQLAEVVRCCYPRQRSERIDPATRTFQALRIAVNEELRSLRFALRRLPSCIRVGGRLAIISFHSLEDRLVKHAFKESSQLKVLTRKPIRPGPEEVATNPRSRSARLRVAERI